MVENEILEALLSKQGQKAIEEQIDVSLATIKKVRGGKPLYGDLDRERFKRAMERAIPALIGALITAVHEEFPTQGEGRSFEQDVDNILIHAVAMDTIARTFAGIVGGTTASLGMIASIKGEKDK